MDDTPLLEITDLAVSFQRGRGGSAALPGGADSLSHAALCGVSLSIFPGQTLALVGESGCGKSVTALSVMRLITCPPARIESGTIAFRGQDLLRLSARRMRHIRGRDIAMIFQEPMTSLNPVFTVGDQVAEAIALHQRMSRRQATELAMDALQSVGIAQHRAGDFPHQFSGGMRQRVMIAMAVACRPALLLADEPTTALDVTTQAHILDLLRTLQATSGLAIMLITHDLALAAHEADVVCVIYGGRVVEYAAASVLFSRPLHPYTRALLACRPGLDVRPARLPTVSQVIQPWLRAQGPWTPWWPADGFSEGYALRQVEAAHWVGCSGADGHASAAPRIEARRPVLSAGAFADSCVAIGA